MTAGVGGNVLNFAQHFNWVNAIEIDSNRYIYLKNNVNLYGYKNVGFYNTDSCKLLLDENCCPEEKISQDIIFFDPPWGGRGYKKLDKIKLVFGKLLVEEVCLQLLQKNIVKMIVVKLPNNYDFDNFKDKLTNMIK